MVKGVKPQGKLPASMYECAVCQDRFWVGSKFVQHMLEDHNVVAESYNCEMCSASYWKKLMLEEHLDYVHKKIMPKTKYPIYPGESIRQRLQRIVDSHNIEDTSNEENATPFSDASHDVDDSSQEENGSPFFPGPIIIHCKAVNENSDENNFSEDSESDTTNSRSSERLVKTRSGRVIKPKKLFYN